MTRARDLANLIGSGNFTTETLTATAGQTAFTPSNTFTSNFLQVFYNGLLLDPTVDYTENGTTITLTVPATAGDEMEVVTYNTFSVGDAITQTEADVRYVNASGDTMSGGLNVGGSNPLSASSKMVIVTDGSSDAMTLYSPSVSTGASVRFVDNIYQAAIRSTPDGVGNTGLAFDVHESEKMRIDSSGRVTTPYQPSFYAYKLVNQFSLSSYSYFDFPSTYYNTGGHYNTSTSRFTAPVNGIYSIHFNVIQLGAVSNMDIAMVVNAGYFYGGRVHLSKSNTGWSNIQWHGNVRLSAGDWIAPYTVSGGDFHATDWARFSGYLIG